LPRIAPYVARPAGPGRREAVTREAVDRVAAAVRTPVPGGEQGPPAIAAAVEVWRTPVFANGWTNYGQGHQEPGFRKDQLGLVRLRGLLARSGGAPVAGETIVTLPEGYRPIRKELFSVTDTATTHVRVDVTADGAVVWVGGSPNPGVSLSGIAFATD